MGYFPVRYDSRVIIYEHKMLIRLAKDPTQVGIKGIENVFLLKEQSHFQLKRRKEQKNENKLKTNKAL